MTRDARELACYAELQLSYHGKLNRDNDTRDCYKSG